MPFRRKQAKPGDVLKLALPDGRTYLLHYMGPHPRLGDAIVANPEEPPSQSSELKNYFERGYVTFYPARLAVAQSLLEVVGHLTPPPVPQRLRRYTGWRVETWVIEDGTKEYVKASLTEDERQLPIAAIWNHEFLIHRLLEGWRPEREGAGVVLAPARRRGDL